MSDFSEASAVEAMARIDFLTGVMPFVDSPLVVTPRLDLRGRVKDWTLGWDSGIQILGFESREAAIIAALKVGAIRHG